MNQNSDQRPWFQVPWDADYRFPTEQGPTAALRELGRRLLTIIAATAFLVLLPLILVVLAAVAIVWILSQAQSSSTQTHQAQPQPAGQTGPPIYARWTETPNRWQVGQDFHLLAVRHDGPLVAVQVRPRTPLREDPWGHTAARL